VTVARESQEKMVSECVCNQDIAVWHCFGVSEERAIGGDTVFDLETNQVVTERVIDLFVHEKQAVGLLRTAFGALHVTPTHPIYDAAQRNFVPAGQLGAPFESLELASSWSTAPVAIGAFQPLSETETVYNLTVANVHTYFAEGLLVHNKSPWDYPADPPDWPCSSEDCMGPLGFGGVGGYGGVDGVAGTNGFSMAGSSGLPGLGAGGGDDAGAGCPSNASVGG
jgi:hypothetical protein